MDHGHGDLYKRQTGATCGCMAAQVREHGLGQMRLCLNAGPVCDDSAAEGSICANAALYKSSSSSSM